RPFHPKMPKNWIVGSGASQTKNAQICPQPVNRPGERPCVVLVTSDAPAAAATSARALDVRDPYQGHFRGAREKSRWLKKRNDLRDRPNAISTHTGRDALPSVRDALQRSGNARETTSRTMRSCAQPHAEDGPQRRKEGHGLAS